MRIILLYTFLAITVSYSFGDKGRSLDYTISDKTYTGFYVSSGKGAPFVLLIHDWDGLTTYEKTRSQMIAKKGYSVFAADLFGKGVRPDKIEDKKKLTGELYNNRNKMRTLLRGALGEAQRLGANVDNGVALGYCFGGTAVLELARSGEKIKGFAVFHGGLQTPEDQDYSNIKGKILILHGGADNAVPIDEFTDCSKKLESAHIDEK